MAMTVKLKYGVSAFAMMENAPIQKHHNHKGAAVAHRQRKTFLLRGFDFLMKKQKLGLAIYFALVTSSAEEAGVEEKYFTQRLNHQGNASATFKQQYFQIDKYAKSKQSPVFVVLGGEWDSKVHESFVSNIAEVLDAHIIYLEHRYYGQSIPFKRLTTENLKHLSFENALADIESFQTYMMKQQGLNGKWVFFGVSYAGTLAAYYLQTRSHLVAGAVASSAPLKARLALDGMEENALKFIPSKCVNSIKAINDSIGRLNEDELHLLKAKFKSPYFKLDQDIHFLAGETAISMVQFGPSWVDFFCKTINSYQSIERPIDGMIAVTNKLLEYNVDIFANGIGAFEIVEIAEFTKEAGTLPRIRQWFYQACSTFGYFPPDGKIILKYKVEMYVNKCRELFGIEDVQSRIDQFNDKYFVQLEEQIPDNLVISNGMIDHWKLVSIEIEDFTHALSHSADIQNQSNRGNIQTVRLRIYDKVKEMVQ